MKAGCLFLIAVMIGAYFGYRELLLGTELGEQTWLPVVLAIVAAMVAGNIQGIFLALRQRSAVDKPRSSWKDGELVGVSGRIQAVRNPIASPFSRTSAVIVEYEIKRTVERENEIGNDLYSGFLMTPCTVTSTQGAVKLVGFPILTEIPPHIAEDEDDSVFLPRAAEYLASCTLTTKAENPVAAIKQLSEILNDADGDLRADFRIKHGGLHLNNEGEPDDVGSIVTKLQKNKCTLAETIIPNGAQVTVFGTYNAAEQTLNIGSGLSKVSHGIKFGTAAEVTGKILRRSVIGSVVFLVIFGAANYYVLDLIGYDLGAFKPILQQIRGVS